MSDAVAIRLARPDELDAMRELERVAGAPFAEIGMHAIADDLPPSSDELREYQADDRAWVAVDTEDVPVGYALAERVDGAAHLEQVSIDPRYARRGIGRALVETVADWGRHQGFTVLTLTTFADVPWNGPYYARLGFEAIDEAELTGELREIREAEIARGLDRWPRIAMARPLADEPGAP